MCKKVIFFVACTVLVFALVPNTILFAANPYYSGKTVRIIVGFSPGGAFDLYARVIARHMPRYIPGNPTVIVENMTGAGSLVSANHMYKAAKPDGLTIGHFHGVVFLKQVLEQSGLLFDARQFKYIGSAAKEYDVILLSKAQGIKSVEEWMKSATPVRIGGTAPLSDSQGNISRILKEVIGLPTRIVDGYKGTADIRIALEGGEIDGSSPSWDAGQRWVEAGSVVPVIQAAPKPLQELPNVPLMINLAKTNEARQIIETVIHGTCLFARPFVLPPATPNERVQILRKAFQETLQDKEFLAETQKAKMSIDPVTSEELEKAVANLFKLPPDLLTKLKGILLK